MKRIAWSIVWLVCLCCADVSGGVFETLRKFQSAMVHVPGRHCLRNGEDTLVSCGGTADELALAFASLMSRQGIESRLVSGTVSMSSEQMAVWMPDIGSCLALGGSIGADGVWTVPMTWVQCRTSYMPLLRGGDAGGIEWLDVFPGLVGADILQGGEASLDESTRQQLASEACAVALDDDGRMIGTANLVAHVRQATRTHLNVQALAWMPCAAWTSAGWFPGYRSLRVQSRCPVKILTSRIEDGTFKDCVKIELGDDAGVLVTGYAFQDSDDGIVEVSWACQGETGELTATLTTGAGGSQTMRSLKTGQKMTVNFSVMSDGNCVETISDRISAGDYAVYGLSTGHSGAVNCVGDALQDSCRQLRHGLDDVRRIAERLFGEPSVGALSVCKIVLADCIGQTDGESRISVGVLPYATGGTVFSEAVSWGSSVVVTDALHAMGAEGIVSPPDAMGQMQEDCVWTADSGVSVDGGRLCMNNDEANTSAVFRWKNLEGEWAEDGVLASGTLRSPCGTCGELEGLEDVVRALSLVKELDASNALSGIVGVEELMVAGVFSALGERLAAREVIGKFEVAEEPGDDGGHVGVLEVELEKDSSWHVEVVASDGTVVFSQDGAGQGGTLRWNGADAAGALCGDGEYTCRLRVTVDDDVIASSRTLVWDVTPPCVTVEAEGKNVDGGRTVDVSYDIQDQAFQAGVVRILEMRTRSELAATEVAEATGRVSVALPSTTAQTCIVQVCGYDESGNCGASECTVVVGAVVVAGRVVGASEDAGGECELVAEVQSPQAGSALSDGVFAVLGSVSADGQAVSYQLRLRDSSGQLLDCIGEEADGRWQLSFWHSLQSESDIELMLPVRTACIQADELALLDVSSLKGGAYTLELVAWHGTKIRTAQAGIKLERAVTVGESSLVETEGTVALGSLSLKLYRRYSSSSGDGDLGHGWALSLDTFEIETYEERQTMEDAEGEQLSVRTGGNRDVTLTLPDGRRTTFVFSLEPGGGMSFAYYGRWQPATDIPWRLTASCDSNVTALPGLDPYWNSAGLGVPLDSFDFPGYILESDDGTKYYFDCESLGDYDAVDDDGGSYSIACYSRPRLARISYPEGGTAELGTDTLVWHDADGTRRDALEYIRNEDGRITGIDFMDGSGIRLRYGYSENGNLVSFQRGIGGGEPELRRVYRYDNEQFPHHLTAVENSVGRVLSSFAYDVQGRLESQGNGMGAEVALRHEPFRQTEIMVDAAGNETVVTTDASGNMLETQYADGSFEQRELDIDGRVLRRRDECGAVTSWCYDDSGRLSSRTDALGNVTSYAYDDAGNCCQVTDPVGRLLITDISDDNRRKHLELPSGKVLDIEKDDDGRPVFMTDDADGREGIYIRYLEDGRIVQLSDENGHDVQESISVEGRCTTRTYSWLDADGQLASVSSEATVDGDGKLVYLCDSFGNTVSYERDEDGQVTCETDQTGHWVRHRMNAAGLEVESWNSDGYVQRTVYNSAGHIMLMAGPELLEHTEDVIAFSTGVMYGYDCRGRVVSERLMASPCIGLRALGGGRYETTLASSGEAQGETSRSYDSCGRVVSETAADGSVQTMVYDALGRLVSVEDGTGGQSTYEYDAIGNMLSVTDSAGNCARWSYDAAGYPSSFVDVDGRVSHFEWMAGGKLLRCEESGCEPIVLTRDGRGHALSVRQGELTLQFERDGFNGLLAVTDALENRRQYVRDAFGRVVESVSPEGRRVSWSYDNCLGEYGSFEAGSLREEIQKDSYGQWIRKVIRDGDGSEHEIARVGEDARSVSVDGAVVWRDTLERDSLGRIARRMGNGGEVGSYGYDMQGRIVRYESPGTAMAFSYGAGGRVSRIVYSRLDGRQLETPVVVSFGYDAGGRVVSESSSEGWERQLSFDAVGRIVSERRFRDNVLEYGGEYRYDEGGRLVEVTENDGGVPCVRRHGYDALGQLVSETLMENGDVVYEWSGQYDAVGSLVGETVSANGETRRVVHRMDGDTCLAESRIVTGQGECVVEYEWDTMGNLASEVCNGAESWRNDYLWDGAGLLRRWRRTCGDDFTEVVFLYDGYGLLRGHERKEYSDGQLVSEQRHDFIFERTLHDVVPQIMDYRLETAGACRDISVKNTFERQWRNGWGEPLGSVDTGIGAFGEWTEGGSGLVYLRGRFYSPRLRRFISADPYPGNEEQPRSFHRYSYCMNDPVNRRDPQGTMSLVSVMTFLDVHLTRVFCACDFMCLLSRFFLYKGTAVSDAIYEYWMWRDFDIQTKMKPNATVFVHGMGYHESGWADDMIDKFKKTGIVNQDYYSFLWSGFAISPLLFLPIPRQLNHTVAMGSLIECMSVVSSKGYEKINVISHSWGTILSRDVLTAMGFHVGLWATMGSPLCEFKPEFPRDHWVNCYNDPDPVTWAAPILYLMGYNHCMKPVREQWTWLSQLKTENYTSRHSSYWKDDHVVQALGAYFKFQPKE